MGACGSVDKNSTKSRKIDAKLVAESKAEKSKIKLLLLGPGDSGKSTLFKQLKGLYSAKPDVSERKQYLQIVTLNVIDPIRKLMEGYNAHKEDEEVVAFGDDMKQLIEDLGSVTHGVELCQAFADPVKKFWESKTIQYIYEKYGSGELDIAHTCPYFLGKLDEIAGDNYIPSEEDILKARSRTTGAKSINLELDGVGVDVYDVGGQKTERKKWLSHFEGCTAIIFLVGISEFNTMMWEDKNKNRLDDGLELFEQVVGNPELRHSSVVLFLNKRDLFEERFTVDSFKSSFAPDFEGETTADAYEYVGRRFVFKNPYPDKQITVHVTCATDENNIRLVFTSVQRMLVTDALQNAGLNFASVA